MQLTTRYLDKRSYIELVLVLAVAVVAVSVGRWVIPTGSDESAALTANHTSVVPDSVESRLANLKQDQLDGEDGLAGFGGAVAPGTSFEDMHPERSWIIQEAR
ncbi:MAG TPA: hypothetical protein VMT90_05885 [Dehalococcoidia bacterium]|jgi:hypothetical protein|nr:hypothetical protein [Dehalococcoidia bacterium]